VRRTSFDEMSCSIARTLEVIGEWWTPLILRDVSLGITRFDAIQRDLGVSRKVLAERLAGLVEHGVLERAPYQDSPARYDYFLTEKGADLSLVLLAMQAWGDHWVFGETGPPMLFRHERCGAVTSPVPCCSACGEQLQPADVTPLPGPSANPGPGTSEIPAALERWRAQRAERAETPLPSSTG
jgi:DNA-binding HxlR family transcriptional regulator